MDTIHLLMQFGLTHQEARIYTHLHESAQATGYELAKATGISRSNTYAGLSSLVEKGGAYLIDGKPARYEAVPVGEFCRNAIRSLQTAQKELEELLPASTDAETAYLTIKGSRHIRDKIETIIHSARYRVYLSMTASLLQEFLHPLEELKGRGGKVVVITDGPLALDGAVIYRTSLKNQSIRLIADSAVALTGSLDDSPGCTCLYSLKENLVALLKDSIQNEIRLIELGGSNR